MAVLGCGWAYPTAHVWLLLCHNMCQGSLSDPYKGGWCMEACSACVCLRHVPCCSLEPGWQGVILLLFDRLQMFPAV